MKLTPPAEQTQDGTDQPGTTQDLNNPPGGPATTADPLSPLDPSDSQTQPEGAAADTAGNEGEGEQGEVDQGSQHVHAPYGFRADGVTPRNKPGAKPKDQAVAQAKDQQRARLRSVTPGAGKIPQRSQIPVTALSVVNYAALGQTAAGMWFYGGEALFGDEWAPNKAEGEHIAIAGAFEQYFKAVQARDLPPVAALCFALGIYGLKRAQKPTVKTKLALFSAWCKDKLAFGRKGLRLATRRGQVVEGAGDVGI